MGTGFFSASTPERRFDTERGLGGKGEGPQSRRKRGGSDGAASAIKSG